MIPKIIHYCWFGHKLMPRVVRRCIATWHEHMPDYEFHLWNEQNSPMEHPYVQLAYKAKKYAFVADYVRFWALYNYGGIYLDTDMYVLRSFNPLLDAIFFCGKELPQSDTISCGVLGACFLCAETQRILDVYDRLLFDENRLDDYIVPRIITPILMKHKENITIYPYDYFYAFPFSKRMERDFMKYCTGNSYAMHLWEISWYPWYKKIIRQVVIEIKRLLRHA